MSGEEGDELLVRLEQGMRCRGVSWSSGALVAALVWCAVGVGSSQRFSLAIFLFFFFLLLVVFPLLQSQCNVCTSFRRMGKRILHLTAAVLALDAWIDKDWALETMQIRLQCPASYRRWCKVNDLQRSAQTLQEDLPKMLAHFCWPHNHILRS